MRAVATRALAWRPIATISLAQYASPTSSIPARLSTTKSVDRYTGLTVGLIECSGTLIECIGIGDRMFRNADRILRNPDRIPSESAIECRRNADRIGPENAASGGSVGTSDSQSSVTPHECGKAPMRAVATSALA